MENRIKIYTSHITKKPYIKYKYYQFCYNRGGLYQQQDVLEETIIVSIEVACLCRINRALRVSSR